MAVNEQEWNVRAPEGACVDCGRGFDDGESFTSRLVFVEGEGYGRRDFCAACAGRPSSGPVVSTWQTQFHAAPEVEEPLKKETAESLLRQLVEKNDTADRNVIYVLAVMLERRRIIVERDVQIMEDGGSRRIYEHRKSGEIWIISDPGLRLSDLEKVQAEVVARLGGTPPGAEPPPSAPGA
jgi:hypothetical protein